MSSVPLRASEIMQYRLTPGRAAGLFLTDKCPVGCAHCSVDSRSDSPTITDFQKFTAIVEGLAGQRDLAVVAITGGEPFVERRGLQIATSMLRAAGKKIVVFTSGIWASESPPEWVLSVLAQVDTVFLSTDAFHKAAVSVEKFGFALKAVAGGSSWIVVQTIDDVQVVGEVKTQLQVVLGKTWEERAEVVLTQPLWAGRGRGVFVPLPAKRGGDYGTCELIGASLLRYDGRISPCCNERVIMGEGSARLTKQCGSAADVDAAIRSFAADPLLAVINRLGMGALSVHPGYEAIGRTRYRGICEACWAANDIASSLSPEDDDLLTAIADLA